MFENSISFSNGFCLFVGFSSFSPFPYELCFNIVFVWFFFSIWVYLNKLELCWTIFSCNNLHHKCKKAFDIWRSFHSSYLRGIVTLRGLLWEQSRGVRSNYYRIFPPSNSINQKQLITSIFHQPPWAKAQNRFETVNVFKIDKANQVIETTFNLFCFNFFSLVFNLFIYIPIIVSHISHFNPLILLVVALSF